LAESGFLLSKEITLEFGKVKNFTDLLPKEYL